MSYPARAVGGKYGYICRGQKFWNICIGISSWNKTRSLKESNWCLIRHLVKNWLPPIITCSIHVSLAFQNLKEVKVSVKKFFSKDTISYQHGIKELAEGRLQMMQKNAFYFKWLFPFVLSWRISKYVTWILLNFRVTIVLINWQKALL